MLELGLIPGNDVRTVVDELHPGSRDDEIVRVDVATGYTGPAGLPEQSQQVAKMAACLLCSLFVRVHHDNLISLLSDLQQVGQRAVSGDLTGQ